MPVVESHDLRSGLPTTEEFPCTDWIQFDRIPDGYKRLRLNFDANTMNLMMWWFHKTLRPKLKELINLQRDDKYLYVLQSQKEVNNFLHEFCT